MTGLGPECVSSRVALLLRLAEHIWVLSICIFLYISFIDMGSKVLVGGLLPLVRRGLPTWVLLVLAFSLAWNRIEPQAVPSGCVLLCTWSLLNYFIVFWMGRVCVCARSCGNRQNVVCAGIFAKSFFDLCVFLCAALLLRGCGGMHRLDAARAHTRKSMMFGRAGHFMLSHGCARGKW
jgi:hypothetical protein